MMKKSLLASHCILRRNFYFCAGGAGAEACHRVDGGERVQLAVLDHERCGVL